MNYTHDPLLVSVSILVACVGAYACFDLVIRLQRTSGPSRRNWLALAALAIGGSIWAMHFLAMLAVELPAGVQMQYDSLTTLISGLASILLTAVALAIVSSGNITLLRIVVAGAIMGVGITLMHYIGMSGMRGSFSLSYDNLWLLVSVLVGVFASTLSLWLAMGLQLRGVLRRSASAVVMGLSIAGVHYSGMYGTTFEPQEQIATFTQPILSPFSLGLITALVTFGILCWTLMLLLPGTMPAVQPGGQPAQTAAGTIERSEKHESYARDANIDIDSATDALQTTPTRDNRLTNTEHRGSDYEPRSLQSDSRPSHGSHDLDLTTAGDSELDNQIPVQRNRKTYFIKLSDIVSISADGHYSTIRVGDGVAHFCNTGFNKLLKEVESENLVRVHRSHAIRLNSVISFERQRDKAIVTLGDDKHEVPVSRTHVAVIKTALGL